MQAQGFDIGEEACGPGHAPRETCRSGAASITASIAWKSAICSRSAAIFCFSRFRPWPRRARPPAGRPSPAPPGSARCWSSTCSIRALSLAGVSRRPAQRAPPGRAEGPPEDRLRAGTAKVRPLRFDDFVLGAMVRMLQTGRPCAIRRISRRTSWRTAFGASCTLAGLQTSEPPPAPASLSPPLDRSPTRRQARACH